MNRNARFLLWAAGIGFGLAATGLAIWALNKPRAEFLAHKKLLEGRGETFDPLALAPKSSGLKNGKDEVLAACTELEKTLGAWPKPSSVTSGYSEKTGLREVGFRQAGTTGVGPGEISWSDASAKIEPLLPMLNQLREAAHLPSLELNLDYSKGLTMKIDIGPIFKCLKHFPTLVSIALAQGNVERAIELVEIQLRLAKMLQRDRILITQLAAGRVIWFAQSSTWEILQSEKITSNQLSRLQTLWSGTDIVSNLVPLLRQERASAQETFALPSSKLAQLFPKESDSSPNFSLQIAFYFWAMFFRHTDNKLFNESVQSLIDESVACNESGNWHPLLRLAPSFQKVDFFKGVVTRMSLPSITAALEIFLKIQFVRDLTLSAIALKRFELDHGEYPESLALLTPGYLPAVPNDIFNGLPLKYRRSEKGDFLLYSVGGNGIDEDGDISIEGKRKDFVEGRDIVWPRAATFPEPGE